MPRAGILPVLATASAVSSVFVKGKKTCIHSLGDDHDPQFTGDTEGLFSAAKMLHGDLWIGEGLNLVFQ